MIFDVLGSVWVGLVIYLWLWVRLLFGLFKLYLSLAICCFASLDDTSSWVALLCS